VKLSNLFSSFAIFVYSACAFGQMTQEEAFELGKSIHPDAASNLTYDNVLNSNKASSLQPYDSNSPDHSRYWTGTQSQTAPVLQGGADLNVQCIEGNDPANDQQRCEAVRFLNQTAASRQIMRDMIPSGDPLRIMGQIIADDPEAIAGYWGGTYTDCQEMVLKYDGDFEYETCRDSLENDTSFCTVGQNVIVDARHLYACRRSLSQLNSGQCTVGRVVTVERNKNYQCQTKADKREVYSCTRSLHVACEQLPVTWPWGHNCEPTGVTLVSGGGIGGRFCWARNLVGAYNCRNGVNGSAADTAYRQYKTIHLAGYTCGGGGGEGNSTESCNVRPATHTINIADVSRISKFTLLQGSVYVPSGGRMPILIGHDELRFNGTTLIYDSSVDNIDLLPLLQNGANTVYIYGYVSAIFSVEEYCGEPQINVSCTDSWNEVCF